MTSHAAPSADARSTNRRAIAVRWTVAAVVITVVGLLVRLEGIGDRILSHPENLVPGIDLPDWAERPPERTTMRGVLVGTLADGHPPLYFAALLPWVKTFGTSLTSFRLPSALLGAASIYLVFLIGRRERGPAVALLAATLLAFHGFHVYWSQMARMYAPVAFLGLLSALWLYRCLDRDRARDYIIYGLIASAALWTQMYAWPLIAAQMLWVAAGTVSGASRLTALRVQILAVASAAPVVQLAMYQNPVSRWHQTATDFFGFGYLYERGLPFWLDQPWVPDRRLAVVLCLALIVIGIIALVRRPAGDTVPARRPAELPARQARGWIDWLVAAGVSAVMLLLAWRWLGRDATLWAVSALPLVIVAFGRFAARILDHLRSADVIPSRSRELLSSLPQTPFLAILPVLMMAGVSIVRGVMVARGTLVYLPFLLLLVSYGVWHLMTRRSLAPRLAGTMALAGIVTLWAFSLRYNERAESSPRDYAGMAAEITARVQPGDLVLVLNNYGQQPLFYYLDRSLDPQLVPGPKDHEAVLGRTTNPRVWHVWFCSQYRHPATERALSRLHLAEVVPVYAGELQLYLRQPLPGSDAPVRPAAAPGFGCDGREAPGAADEMES